MVHRERQFHSVLGHRALPPGQGRVVDQHVEPVELLPVRRSHAPDLPLGAEVGHKQGHGVVPAPLLDLRQRSGAAVLAAAYQHDRRAQLREAERRLLADT